MKDTRTSLLLRIRDRSDSGAWNEFHALYAPLLYHFARSRGLSQADSEEVRDGCLAILARKMRSFDYDRERGRFKNWLRRIAENQCTDLLRQRRERVVGNDQLRGFPAATSTPAQLWEEHWRDQHLRYCVNEIRPSVGERTYQIFEFLLFMGYPVKEVCQRLGVNANTVYKAKARVLERVRQKMGELGLDDL